MKLAGLPFTETCVNSVAPSKTINKAAKNLNAATRQRSFSRISICVSFGNRTSCPRAIQR
jgi:hypothetical protein